MEPISVVIADDESLAREGLSVRLKQLQDVQLLDACSDGHSALHSIKVFQPDVVFLDIEMPGMTGIELIEQLSFSLPSLPYIVFVTAYDEFAVKAYELQAQDYLLKPYTDCRLESCLQRVRSHIQEKHLAEKESKLERLLVSRTGKSIDSFIQTLEHSTNTSYQQLKETVSLKSGSEWFRIKFSDVLWIEAAGDYLCIHTDDDTLIIRNTLKQLEQEWDAERFVRINRSAMVNLARVVRLTPNSNGEYFAHLDSGQQVKVSRKYKFNLQEINPT